MTPQPARRLAGVLSPALVAGWRAAADQAFADPAIRRVHGFVPTASSLRLSALPQHALIDAVWAALGPDLTAALAGPVAVNLDNAWLRRQYPLGAGPRWHAPHGWHQDGALGHDFLSPPADDPGLVTMITTWIPLVACGVDAPGLTWVGPDRPDLLPLAALQPAAVDAQYPPAEHQRPALSPGDALWFGGGVLHRTHATAEMTAARTSVELRWLRADALPARLAAHAWRTLPRAG